MGTSAHEGIKVPFQLPPGQANECQFTFYVQSFLMPQKLRGTLTYMVKSEQGTSGEKIDFKVQLPCSAFICPVPCAQWVVGVGCVHTSMYIVARDENPRPHFFHRPLNFANACYMKPFVKGAVPHQWPSPPHCLLVVAYKYNFTPFLVLPYPDTAATRASWPPRNSETKSIYHDNLLPADVVVWCTGECTALQYITPYNVILLQQTTCTCTYYMRPKN